VRRANKYIDETAPWVLAKDDTKQAELATVLYNLSEILRIMAIVIGPVMPNTPSIIFTQLNIAPGEITEWEQARKFGLQPRALQVTKGPAAFPRIERAKNEVN